MSGRVMKSTFPQEQAVSTTTTVLPKVIINEKQGIVSILGSDCERTRGGAASLSLRRTLSADMSSKKWLAQNGFRPIMKKIASSEELPISSSSIPDHHHSYPSSSSSSLTTSSEEEEEEEDQEELRRPGQDEVWMSIQSGKQKEEKATNGWTWDSILTQKNGEEEESKENQNQPPYIHPLVKRSTSSLSEKSLEICTESLGSETGSDGFSSYSPSEAGDLDEEKQQPQQQQSDNNSVEEEEEDLEIKFSKYNDNNNNYSNRKIMQQQSRSFPPPLPSLAVRQDGASLHMHCHRQNGRLVLEAVSVPSQNYFHAQRQDGRLLLTLINNPSSSSSSQDHDEMEEEQTEEYTRVFDNIEEEEENDDDDEFLQDQDDEFEIEEEQMEEKFESKRSSEMEYYVPEQISRFPGAGGGGGVGLMNVDKSALVMKKVMSINNKNLTWSPKFNKTVNRMIGVEEEEGEEDDDDDELTAGLMNVDKSALVMKKVMSINNKNLTWSPKFYKAINGVTGVEEEEGEDDDDDELTAQIPLSLPPPPRMISTAASPAVAASFNAYEYFWRQQKPSVANIIKQIPPSQPPSLKYKEMMNQNLPTAAGARNSKGYHYHHRHHEQQKQSFRDGNSNNNNNNVEYLVRRCNDSRKSLLLWGEPYCIATS